MRKQRYYAPCPGIGWERREPRRSNLIGGRSNPRRGTSQDGAAGQDEPDDDVIVRGRD